jgi:chromosome partitioning protein
MTKVICVANQKGGVGKTTTAVTLAHGLSLKGKAVLIIDLDPQGQCATALGLESEGCVFKWLVAGLPVADLVRVARSPKLHLMPGDQQTAFVQVYLSLQNRGVDYLALMLKPLRRTGLDYVVFDTSPSVGGMQERALYAADYVVVPTACDFLSADSVAKTMGTMAGNARQGSTARAVILPTFFDNQTIESRGIIEQLIDTYRDQVLPPIHRATVLRECASEGKTIWEMDGSSRAGTEYAQLLYKVLRYG